MSDHPIAPSAVAHPTMRRAQGVCALIGSTPLLRINSLSHESCANVLGKAEFLNPGGSSKDRVALRCVEEAERMGLLRAGGTIVEGTSGSTGASLALVARARGYRCVIVMPDDQAKEKYALLRALGAKVVTVKPASIARADHYVHVARALAERTPGAWFVDQFENLANERAHYEGTGREIVKQCEPLGGIDAFVMSAGTGGTIAGVSRRLREACPKAR